MTEFTSHVPATRPRTPRSVPPSMAWKRRGDAKDPPASVHSMSRPSFMEILKLLPVAFRLIKHIKVLSDCHRTPFLDLSLPLLQPPKPGPNAGVPLGGIGGGCIGRGWKGDFRQWSLFPGKYENCEVIADQFSVHVARPSGLQVTKVLSLRSKGGANGSLQSWDWGISPEKVTYHGLNPRAWTVYTLDECGLRLTCRQVSPVIPHNYTETSLPVSVFAWTVENLLDEEVNVSIMFTFQNGTGSSFDYQGGHSNHYFESDDGAFCGVNMQHVRPQATASVRADVAHKDTTFCSWLLSCCQSPTKAYQVNTFIDPASFTIAMPKKVQGIEASYCSRFSTTGKGEEVWIPFQSHGKLLNKDDTSLATPGIAIGCAVAQKAWIAPHSLSEMEFSLSWDMPLARFGAGRALPRRYTHFFGTSGRAGPQLAIHALESFHAWEDAIEDFQAPMLLDPTLPEWYKSQIFNELYFLVNGGTLWTTTGAKDDKTYVSDPKDRGMGLSKPAFKKDSDAAAGENALIDTRDPFGGLGGSFDEMGHFLYMEGQEYLMYNTYDVHFYASFALIMLWPKLQLNLQRDFARGVSLEDKESRYLISNGQLCARKVKDIIPHDVGSPGEDPWNKVNAYVFQDVGLWKDLGPKFVLSVYRDYIATGDVPFLREVFPALKTAMERSLMFDRDNDGLIENEGFPDQTYDIWTVEGPSAYTGGLWLGAMTAFIEMSKLMNEHALAKKYSCKLQSGKQAYQKLLWNGAYYKYDSSSRPSSKSIMADQVAGQWYARACGLQEIVPSENAASALRMVYEYNVNKFGKGQLGAVNGMQPDGTIDASTLQSREVWPGTTYGVSAAMIQESMFEKSIVEQSSNVDLRQAGFATAQGIHDAGWHKFGYWFQTPEAWEQNGQYRSLGYMRPLAIWSMQWALTVVPRLQNARPAALTSHRGQEKDQARMNVTSLNEEESLDTHGISTTFTQNASS